jgi:hypothetical protein
MRSDKEAEQHVETYLEALRRDRFFARYSSFLQFWADNPDEFADHWSPLNRYMRAMRVVGRQELSPCETYDRLLARFHPFIADELFRLWWVAKIDAAKRASEIKPPQSDD